MVKQQWERDKISLTDYSDGGGNDNDVSVEWKTTNGYGM